MTMANKSSLTLLNNSFKYRVAKSRLKETCYHEARMTFSDTWIPVSSFPSIFKPTAVTMFTLLCV